MEERELRKISKKELLELLLEQANRIVDLEKELSITKKQLNDKKIMIDESGSIAEASLKITDLFNKTMQACEIYKLNVQLLNERVEKEVRSKYEKLEKKKLRQTEIICNKKMMAAQKCLDDARKEKKEKAKKNK